MNGARPCVTSRSRGRVPGSGMKRGVDEGVGGGRMDVGRRAGGRNVTQHIDLSFVGRVTESMMGRWGHADRRAPTLGERAGREGRQGIQGGR